MSVERLQYLLAAYADRTCTDSELQELHDLLANEWTRIKLGEDAPGVDWEKMYRAIVGTETGTGRGRVVTLRKWWWAAAAIILLIGSGILFMLNRGKEQPVIADKVPVQDVHAPANNRAVIILANGQKVYLDSASDGTLATQQNITLIKKADGQIEYSSSAPSPLEREGGEVYNTLSNPRGSKVIDMTLSDGSHVWLNAGSSITYPVAFKNNERKVSVTGEAYFEVTHDASKPFYVTKGEIEVKVLGTHFNVNAYDDEEDIRVTLLEGSVRVSQQSAVGSQQSVTIKPGEQAVVTHHSPLTTDNPDLEEVMAWKNGRFQFNGTDLKEIMKQVARWYDMEVVYDPAVKEMHFTGGIERQVEASKVFSMLEATQAIHFTIDQKKIYVKP